MYQYRKECRKNVFIVSNLDLKTAYICSYPVKTDFSEIGGNGKKTLSCYC